jgi:hypothetical protein
MIESNQKKKSNQQAAFLVGSTSASSRKVFPRLHITRELVMTSSLDETRAPPKWLSMIKV